MKFLDQKKLAGYFKGYDDQYVANLVLPYGLQDNPTELHDIPIIGQFILIELPNDSITLGRISTFNAGGRLTQADAEDTTLIELQERRNLPTNMLDHFLKFHSRVHILGTIKNISTSPIFVPTQRRIPPFGSWVYFPSDSALQFLAGEINNDPNELGDLAFGDFIHSDDTEVHGELFEIIDPNIKVKFDINNLVSKRSFVFARAGFGKSNLTKKLFSDLYEDDSDSIGTIIFDPEGEYFWPDNKGRPGLCDVPHLEDKLLIFTDRKSDSEFYSSFIGGGLSYNFNEFSASEILSIYLHPEILDQAWVRNFMDLGQRNWTEIIELYQNNPNANVQDLKNIIQIVGANPDAQYAAAHSNLKRIFRNHDSNNNLITYVLDAMSEGKICIIDISMLSSSNGMRLIGLVLRNIFNMAQERFTNTDSEPLQVIAAIEEAQSVLNSYGTTAVPIIEWVKEGRKYGLGSFLITQQPGSIDQEILSQGDNWFVFHLLSKTDLNVLGNANSNFSDDIQFLISKESLPGNGFYWSSSSNRQYPIGFRGNNFGEKINNNYIGQYKPIDPENTKKAANTFASKLKKRKSPQERKKGKSEETINGANNEISNDSFSNEKWTNEDWVIQSKKGLIFSYRASRYKNWLVEDVYNEDKTYITKWLKKMDDEGELPAFSKKQLKKYFEK